MALRDWFETTRRCSTCRAALIAQPVNADPPMWRKSVPVFMCPRCDGAPDPESERMHRSLKNWRPPAPGIFR